MDEKKLKARDQLLAARNLIDKGWTRGASARNAKGEAVYYGDPTAVTFCLIGSIHAVGALDTAYYAVWDALIKRGGSKVMSQFNDEPGRTKDDVLALIDEAIALV